MFKYCVKKTKPFSINVTRNPSNLFLRIFCPANCKTQPSYWSPVIGSNIYTDVSKTLF